MAKTFFGGSFAPPLTDEILAEYQGLINQVPEKTQLRDALDRAFSCVSKWWELPESDGVPKPHPVNGETGTVNGVTRKLAVQIVPLNEEFQKQLWDDIPWDDEIASWGRLFEGISATDNKKLRDAAHHLLWHVVELSRDREPITNDRI